MREREWSAPRLRSGRLIERPGFAVDVVVGLGQTLLSGALEQALASLAPGARILGLGALATAAPYVLRISRDQALLVTETPLTAADGWHGGYALTRMDAAYAVLDLSGGEAAGAIAEATASDLAASSPSSAVMFAGLRSLLVTRESGFRLHVEAAWREAVLEFLSRS
jgi:hypothetical protein